MLYVDTSIIVSALTNEADTALSQAWLAKQEISELTISDWTTTEFASALSIKLRTGALGADARAAALSAFTRLCAESFGTLPVGGKTFAQPRALPANPSSNFAQATPFIWRSAPITEPRSARSIGISRKLRHVSASRCAKLRRRNEIGVI
jgi:hypothetical protein